MPTIAQLKSDGLACFTHVESGAKLTASPAIGVMQKISDALSDKDFVGSKLHELEKELSDELCRRLPQQPNRVESFNAMYPVRHETVRTAPTPEYRGLFSTVMRKRRLPTALANCPMRGVSAPQRS